MSKKPNEVRPQVSKTRHTQNLMDVMKFQVQYHDLKSRIESKLPQELIHPLTRKLVFIETKGMCGAKITLHFEVERRVNAVEMMNLLPPLPLTLYYTHNRRRVLWCPAVGHMLKFTGTADRTEIMPFLFSVNQGANYGPKVMVNWVTRVGDIFAFVNVEVEKDPACFILVPNGAMLNSLKRWKWERSIGFPTTGRKWGSWGYWMMVKGNEDARCTCYWPLYDPDESKLVHTLADKYLLDSSSRWEGQHGKP
jgi:hypothetical protein